MAVADRVLAEAARGAVGDRLGPGAVSAVASRVVEALGDYQGRRRRTLAARLTNEMRRQYPEVSEDAIRGVVVEELDREGEFARKALERWEDDLRRGLERPGKDARREALEGLRRREAHYTRMREKAARERASGRLDQTSMKVASPRGAFWRLSDDVRNHTPDCIAMARWGFWPWRVLDKVFPPIHHGCPCSLHTEEEARVNGWMTPGDVTSEANAVRRARTIAKRYPELMAQLRPEEVPQAVDLSEALWREALHPRDRRGQWARKPVRDLARLMTPARGTAKPALADAELEELAGEERQRRREGYVLRAAEDVAAGHAPHVEVGDGPDVLLSLMDAGFELAAVEGRSQTFRHPAGGEARVVLDEEGRVAEVENAWRGADPAEALERAPEDFEEFSEDMMAAARELGAQWGRPTNARSFAVDEVLPDTAGLRSWMGDVTIGPDAEDSVDIAAELRRRGEALPDTLLAHVWLAQQTAEHEIAHTVNPIDAETYMGDRAAHALEEALKEEVSHILAVERLRAQGQDDVVDWYAAHRDSPYARGSYQPEREGLRRLLTRAGVPPELREDMIFGLSFDVAPERRVDFLAGLIHDHKPFRRGMDAARAFVRANAVGHPAAPHSISTAPDMGEPEGREQAYVEVGEDSGPLLDLDDDLVWFEGRDGMVRARRRQAEINRPVEVWLGGRLVRVGEEVLYRSGRDVARARVRRVFPRGVPTVEAVAGEDSKAPGQVILLRADDLAEELSEAAVDFELVHPRDRLGRWVRRQGRRHVIAIDGPAGAGKSTVARGVAQATRGTYVDTGALFRVAGLAALRARDPVVAVARARVEDSSAWLDGEDVSEAIRAGEVDMAAARLGGVAEVRAAVNERVAEIVAEPGVHVVDGRDAGASLGAETRVFLTADLEMRALRRATDREADYEETVRGLAARDELDAPRLERAASYGARFDTTVTPFEVTVGSIVDLAEQGAGMEREDEEEGHPHQDTPESFWERMESIHGMQEGYREGEHPRDRLGRWVRGLGLPAYKVGGAVRDPILGKDPKDVDYMVAAPPEAIKAAVEASGHHADDLTVRDRLVGVRAYGPELPEGGVELAPPRVEVSTGPSRHDFVIVPHTTPESAEALAADARRRDFTVNALYEDEEGNRLDPTGRGVADAEAGVLHVIGEDSFAEDPLRILRGLRFVSQHGLEPDEFTLEQMVKHAPGVRDATMTRKGGVSGTAREELDKLLMGENVGGALRLARDTGVLWHFIPELAPIAGFEQESKFHDLTLDEHTIRAVEGVAAQGGPLEARLAALFHDSGKPETAWRGADGRLHYYANAELGIEDHADAGEAVWRRASARLNYPEELRRRVATLVREHMLPETQTKRLKKVRRLRQRVGDEMASMLVVHRRADRRAKGASAPEEDIDRLEAMLERTRGDAVRRADLAITGSDLVAAGVPEGPEVGRVLEELLEEVLGNPALNTRERLMERALKLARGLVEANIYREALHRRDRAGKWADMPGVLPKPRDRGGSAISLPQIGGAGNVHAPGSLVSVPRGMRPASAEDKVRLRIPPAWADPHVSEADDARLVAVGVDSKGRVQRMYSAAHHEAQAAEKFARIRRLARAMPRVDDAIAEGVARGDDTASAMMLVRKLGLRPGSTRDRGGDRRAFGATTLLRRHVEVQDETVRLRFVGKKGVDIDLEVEDAELAAMLRSRLARGENEPLFPGTDESALRGWVSAVAPGFKPKDFRTMLATAEASLAVRAEEPPKSKAEYRKRRASIGDRVARLLGNTRQMALNSYIDPTVWGAWEEVAA